MHPLVRNLYKRLMLAGRDYPGRIELVRKKAKQEFQKNSMLEDEFEIRKAVRIGRWWVSEIHAINFMKKYREMKKRYENDDAKSI